MQETDLKSICQFCLKEQIAEHAKIPINRQLKQSFFKLTQKKVRNDVKSTLSRIKILKIQLNTSRYSEYICCNPCLQEFESVVTYRDNLLKNQRALSGLHRTGIASVPEPHLKLEEEHLDESLAIVKLEHDVHDKEFVDAEAITECANCHEELNESSLDHHVCHPRVKLEVVEEEFEDESSMEQDTLDDSPNKKKKYPKKKLLNPITCPKCDRQFFYKAYFQFHYKDVHRDDREEICQFCGKVFKNSRRLNSHILIHQADADRKYKCDKCCKQFNFSGDLTRHKRVS